MWIMKKRQFIVLVKIFKGLIMGIRLKKFILSFMAIPVIWLGSIIIVLGLAVLCITILLFPVLVLINPDYLKIEVEEEDNES